MKVQGYQVARLKVEGLILKVDTQHSTALLTDSSGLQPNEVHRIFSLFPVPWSLFPVPCSLKLQNLYLT
ncbi:hypothetical protein BJP34_06765 [Moorena producens PAL-8-15-08-1]|uniref:Uncharacterized protein n=1 Tax=Moorena producens PAL-8-15-08-1 TaxID=1458985 RepID=A0A1D8TNM7_9CYAN|nr:hypothetical protein BJP34_06765 [Moorena producens PAL-8-15-08-1]